MLIELPVLAAKIVLADMHACVRAMSHVDARRPQSDQLMMRGMVQVQELGRNVTTDLVEVHDVDDDASGTVVIRDKGVYQTSLASSQALFAMRLNVPLPGECDGEKECENLQQIPVRARRVQTECFVPELHVVELNPLELRDDPFDELRVSGEPHRLRQLHSGWR